MEMVTSLPLHHEPRSTRLSSVTLPPRVWASTPDPSQACETTPAENESAIRTRERDLIVHLLQSTPSNRDQDRHERDHCRAKAANDQPQRSCCCPLIFSWRRRARRRRGRRSADWRRGGLGCSTCRGGRGWRGSRWRRARQSSLNVSLRDNLGRTFRHNRGGELVPGMQIGEGNRTAVLIDLDAALLHIPFGVHLKALLAAHDD